MEAGIVETRAETMAGLAALTAKRFGDEPALRRKVGDEWVDTTYAELGQAVSEIARGLIGLGIEGGDRVAILSHTRPEWTLANLAILAAGGVSVSVYQTNSPEEVHYVLHHSESRAVFVEDAEQLAKIRAIEGDLPLLEHAIVFEPGEDRGGETAVTSLGELRGAGRGRDAAEVERRTAAVAPEDACVFVYTSGTTGPPKAVILTHGNYRAITDMVVEAGEAVARGEAIYLFLPLAHVLALLVQLATLEVGGVLAYWSKDPQKILPELMEVKPLIFPSVPRIFEKLYTLAQSNAPDPERMQAAVEVGLKVRMLRERGEPVPPELERAFEEADEALFAKVRALFGGRIDHCVTGAAPIAKEILEFFYACGVPVMEGYGMTETSTSATLNFVGAFRFGSVGRPWPGVDMRIADDGEILLRGPNIFAGYYKNEEATRETVRDGWLHTGDLGHVDDEGFLYITGRKKDIIITAGGKNVTPANLENELKQSRWISQAVVIGDRRPYLVALIALDADELPAFAQEHGLEVDQVAGSEAMREEVQLVVDRANGRVGRVEQIKRFTILPHDLTQESGELTPTLKVKRNVIGDRYADEIEALYSG